MDKKISLDLANNNYYFHVPAAAHKHLFSSIFAIDHFLNALATDTSIDTYGYCLFDHSVHILIRCQEKPSLWLEPFLMAYNQWHQVVTGDSGYLFNDNATRTLLVQPKQLPNVLRYIHQLPILKKVASTVAQYEYTSYHDYIDVHPSPVIKDQFILALLSPNTVQRKRRFQNYMAKQLSAHELRQMIEGSLPFHFAISDARFLTKSMTQYTTSEQHLSNHDTLQLWQECVSMLSQLVKLEDSYILGSNRHHSMPDAHHLLAWLFVEVAKGPIQLASRWLNIDEMTLTLNIRSVQLHHPASFLRYIVTHWHQKAA